MQRVHGNSTVFYTMLTIGLILVLTPIAIDKLITNGMLSGDNTTGLLVLIMGGSSYLVFSVALHYRFRTRWSPNLLMVGLLMLAAEIGVQYIGRVFY